jgi:ribose 5-phosphate isomerase B
MRRVGLAADHAGFGLKAELTNRLARAGYDVVDFGATRLELGDDYPDYVVPLARSVAGRDIERGIAVCGSGVGASIIANRIPGVRAALVHDIYSAHQGVEHDDMNLIALGGRVVGEELAWDLVRTFLDARFSGEERHRRRLAAVGRLEALERAFVVTPPTPPQR